MAEEEEEEEEVREKAVWSTESWMRKEAEAASALHLAFAGWLLGLQRGLVWGRRVGKSEQVGSEVRGTAEAKKINIWLGEWDRRQGEKETERATSLLGDQSTGRFSPCFFVNSSAFFKNFLRSFENSSARSALRGCSGWGSFTSAMRAWITARQSRNRIRQDFSL